MADTISSVVDLNVGGAHFTTTLSTLTKYPDRMLAAMFSVRHVINKDKDGRYVIHCDGTIFKHILEFPRFGTLPSGEVAVAVHRYSEYFGLHELSKILCDNQQVKLVLHVRDMQQHLSEYVKLVRSVVDNLNTKALHKDTTAFIVIKQHRPKMYHYDCFTYSRDVLPKFTFRKRTFEVYISNTFLDFEYFENIQLDAIFFLTANHLQSLSYGCNVLYSNGTYNDDISCFLICKDHVLSLIDTFIMHTKFRTEPQ
ncbi:BTB/POZ domain-containing protein KCTD18-like isoform X2 [Dreissena polymorpha]|uniref:BTB/POZ domain-containing protein KCTD18-like isoform X1 n=1 Tax=Dreissena polymorpha TaxID=45954 RepID=UPI002265544B|nr:BTB/POZ domain-containing protein KCTD18-like isoform X1 [Dreissena polymorpha]XP_052236672.1 BTB/POZ domain-containing protein KCTD18-like isoform X2 [Dreissena polymorpha]